YVLAVARTIGRHMSVPTVVVNKSTVPVATADKVRAAIAAELAARGYVLAVARTIGRHMSVPTVVVNKSTVPVATADKV
ncbi:hypothetical protein C7E12_22185, partial [Stenotrophomonas maltophilia]